MYDILYLAKAVTNLVNLRCNEACKERSHSGLVRAIANRLRVNCPPRVRISPSPSISGAAQLVEQLPLLDFVVFCPIILHATRNCFLIRDTPALPAITSYHPCVLKAKGHRSCLRSILDCNHIDFPIIWHVHPKVFSLSHVSAFAVIRPLTISRHRDSVKLETGSIIIRSST